MPFTRFFSLKVTTGSGDASGCSDANARLGRECVRFSGVSVAAWKFLFRGYQMTFRLKTWCRRCHFEYDMNVELVDTWMTPQGPHGGTLCFFLLFFLHLKKFQLLQLYWIWLNHCLPLRLQTCFLDSNTSPSPPIGIVVSRRYRFKHGFYYRAVPVQNLPVWNGLFAWSVVMLVAAFFLKMTKSDL